MCKERKLYGYGAEARHAGGIPLRGAYDVLPGGDPGEHRARRLPGHRPHRVGVGQGVFEGQGTGGGHPAPQRHGQGDGAVHTRGGGPAPVAGGGHPLPVRPGRSPVPRRLSGAGRPPGPHGGRPDHQPPEDAGAGGTGRVGGGL